MIYLRFGKKKLKQDLESMANMLKNIEKIPWDSSKDALIKNVNEVYEKVTKDGYLMNPTLYVLKCKKCSKL
jgi:hypothetical protein